MKKIILFITSVVVGLIIISLIIELFEVLIVMFLSGKDLNELQTNQEMYFSIRNQTWFLALKLGLSVISGVIAGYLSTRIAKGIEKPAIYSLASIQFASLIYGMLFSPFKDTTPIGVWIALTLLIPISILVGGYYGLRKLKG